MHLKGRLFFNTKNDNVRHESARAKNVVRVLLLLLIGLTPLLSLGLGFPFSFRPVAAVPTDYQFFIAPYQTEVENLRQYLMSPPNPSTAKIGYNAQIGLIQGDYLCGGYQPDATLDDPNMILGSTLDYLNSQKGVSTNIASTTRQYLQGQFNNTMPSGYSGCASTTASGNWTYQGDNRREFLFGTSSPYYPSDVNTGCVHTSSGYVFLVSPSAPIVISSETSDDSSCATPSAPAGMNIIAVYVDYLWLRGETTTATTLFDQTISAWTATPGTGLNGTTGGDFSSSYDGVGNGCRHSRVLYYWLQMARATGLWSSSPEVQTVAQQVVNEIWAHQNPDGSMMVNWPGCGSTRDSGESDGLTLIAFDPRLSEWFGGTSSTTSQTTASSTTSQTTASTSSATSSSSTTVFSSTSTSTTSATTASSNSTSSSSSESTSTQTTTFAPATSDTSTLSSSASTTSNQSGTNQQNNLSSVNLTQAQRATADGIDAYLSILISGLPVIIKIVSRRP